MKHITQILTICIASYSCGLKKKEGNDNAIIAEKMQNKLDCSLNSDFLDGEQVFTVVDKMPDYKGGLSNYYDLIGKEIGIPDEQTDWQSITVVFIVDTLGRVRNECLLTRTSIDSLTVVEKETLKAVQNHQEWIPGFHKGKKVAVKLILPFKVGHRG